MKTIKKDMNNITIINKSKFICILKKIDCLNDIEKLLEEIKKTYKDATHYCYAYIIDNIKRFNDDGEPSGTAGMPILNVLESNELDHILCIVIRYFGGIKLGAGGLIRAYSNSVTNTLENTEIINLEKGYLISINFLYDKTKEINYLLKDYEIVNKEFNDNVNYKVKISENDFNLIKEKINNYIVDMSIIDNIYI